MNSDLRTLAAVPIVALAIRVFAVALVTWLTTTVVWSVTQDAVWKSMADVGAAIMLVELLAVVAVVAVKIVFDDARWLASRL